MKTCADRKDCAHERALRFKKIFWAVLALLCGAGYGLVTLFLVGWIWIVILVAAYLCVSVAFVGGLCIAAAEGDR
jgi:hypothetical protein